MPAMAPTRPYGILLVEDDTADALLIRDALLERDSCHVITQAEDGVAALQRLNDPALRRPDLIVLDLNMPRMNGHELLEILKKDDDLKVIPVVVLSTSQAHDDIVGAYRRHASAYIAKPVNLDDFVRAVRSIDTFFADFVARIPQAAD
jgi:CheY-like chemotaxis protein